MQVTPALFACGEKKLGCWVLGILPCTRNTHPHFWKQEQLFWSMIQLYSLLWRAPRAFMTDITRVKHVLDPPLKPQNIVSSAISVAGTDEEGRHFSWIMSAAWGIVQNIHTVLQSSKYLFSLGDDKALDESKVRNSLSNQPTPSIPLVQFYRTFS